MLASKPAACGVMCAKSFAAFDAFTTIMSVVGEAIDEAVVLERAALVEDRRVVHLADGERGDVVRRHVVDEVDRARRRAR